MIALYGLPQTSSWIAWLSGLLNLSAPYGPRRVAVDAAKNLGISLEGLKAHGGYTDAGSICADQVADQAREEAKAMRAQIRGELQEEKTQ